MEDFRRAVCWLALPANALAAAWVALAGWSVELVPLASWLLISTLLCLARYRRKGELTTGMAWAQVVAWIGMLVFGAAAVEDAGDRLVWPGLLPGREGRAGSWLTDLSGWTEERAEMSESVAELALTVALVSWLVLFVLLVLDLRRHLVTNWIPEERPAPSGAASRRRDLGERNASAKR